MGEIAPASPPAPTAGGVPAGGQPADAVAVLYCRYQSALLHVAAGYVGSRSVAEDVVQDALLGAIAGLPRFNEQSSLKTWLFRILENIAKTKAKREARTVPFSAMAEHLRSRVTERPLPAGPPERHLSPAADHDGIPESRLLLSELSCLTRQAIEGLPPRERAVIVLRAVEGCSPQEVCQRLRISDTSQRAALHRARAKIRACLDPYLMLERT